MLKLSNQKLTLKLETSERRLETLMQDQQVQLTKLNAQADVDHREMLAGCLLTSGISEQLKWIREFGQEIMSTMRELFLMTCSIYRIVVDIKDRLPSQAERMLYGQSFLLEDPLGRTTVISLQFINSWETFDAALEVRFRDRRGYNMVRQRQYVLHEGTTNRDINRRSQWDSELLPGQRIVMCMLFLEYTKSSCCPSCYCSADLGEDFDVQWWVLLSLQFESLDSIDEALPVEYGFADNLCSTSKNPSTALI